MSRIHARERLFCRLDRASRGGLVWVHGPPGAGKTVLVSSWLEQRTLRALWLQLDCGDADEATLFHYLGLASRKMLPHASIPAFSLQTLATLGAYSRSFFRALFAARETPMLLVFDDYHTLPEDSAVHACLAEGLEECPASGGVVIMSRHEPPATWTRLRMRERLEVIRPEELLFSGEESAAIVALRTGRHDPEPVTRVHGHSAGWAAGLVLLLEAGKEPGHLSADESVFDFLAEEVLAGVDMETRSVLLATSLLPDVSADLAVGLSGVARAGHALSKLARRGYFTANFEGTSSYRYHPLFRRFLRQRASEQWGHRIQDLHAHAARLLAEAGHLEDAIELASQAQAWDDVLGDYRTSNWNNVSGRKRGRGLQGALRWLTSHCYVAQHSGVRAIQLRHAGFALRNALLFMPRCPGRCPLSDTDTWSNLCVGSAQHAFCAHFVFSQPAHGECSRRIRSTSRRASDHRMRCAASSDCARSRRTRLASAAWPSCRDG